MRKSVTRYALTALICLAGLLLGCSTAVPPSYYRLDYRVETGAQNQDPLPYVLAVPPVNAPETIARSNILYRVSPRILRHYQSRFWEQSPDAVTHQQLVRSLRAANVFKSVTTRRLVLEADYSLALTLTAFEEVRQGKERTAMIGIIYELSTIRPPEILFSGKAESQKKVPGGDVARPEVMAETMSQALKECLDEIVAEVAEKVRAHRSS